LTDIGFVLDIFYENHSEAVKIFKQFMTEDSKEKCLGMEKRRENSCPVFNAKLKGTKVQ